MEFHAPPGEGSSGCGLVKVAGYILLGAGIAQGLAAIVFFYAANWWSLAPWMKTVPIGGGLVLSAFAAAVLPTGSFGRAGAAFAGATLSGVLFAVHGQIWQTGADAWQLFAVWTLFAGFWAVVSGSSGVWALTTAIGIIAAQFRIETTLPADSVPEEWRVHLVAAVPVATAAILWGVRTLTPLRAPGGAFFAILFAAMFAFLVVGGLASLSRDGLPLPFVLSLGIAALIAGWRRVRPGTPWSYAAAVTAGVVLIEGYVIFHAVEFAAPHGTLTLALALLGVAGFLLGGIGWLARHLKTHAGMAEGLSALPKIAEGRLPYKALPSKAMEQATAVAIGVGAWMAALTAVGGLAALSVLITELSLVISLIVAIPSLLVVIATRDTGSFMTRTRAAFAVAAYGSLLIGTRAVSDDPWSAAILSIPLSALVIGWVAAAEAGFLAAAISSALVAAAFVDYGAMPLAVQILVMAAAGWRMIVADRGSMRGAGLALVGSAFLIPILVALDHPDLVEETTPLHAATAIAAVGLLAMAWRREPSLRDHRIPAAAAVVILLGFLMPIGMAGLVGLAAVAAAKRSLTPLVIGLAMAGWSVGRFYHLLAIPLDEKALALAVGAALTMTAWLTLARPTLSLRPGLLGRGALVAFLLCATAPVGLEAIESRAKAKVAATGVEVFLPMAPRDPRSLIQGDYMAFSYAPGLLGEMPPTGGPGLLTVDADGVGQRVRPDDGTRRPDEIPVTLYAGRHRPRLAPESFLFEEGTAEIWEEARFAMVRILDRRLVMVGLADVDRNRLEP